MSSFEDRLAKLEADSHPPIDLTPAMDELLNQRGYLPASVIAKLMGEPDEDMLNAAQERLCQISSRTNFNDHEQAEMFKAMVREALQGPADLSGPQQREAAISATDARLSNPNRVSDDGGE